MERRAPFVLAWILFLLGVSVAQDDVVRTKGQGVPALIQGLAKTRPAASAASALKTQALANYSRLPLSFEPNQGQAGSPVKYLVRGGQFNVFLTQDQVAFGFARRRSQRRSVLDMEDSSALEPPELSSLELRLVGANPSSLVLGEEQLGGTANYLVGRDPSRWHMNLPTFAKVRYRNVYPGVDLLYYGNQGELESDIIIAPGANPAAVKLSVVGAEKVAIDPSGDLVLRMKDGELRLRKPLVYQTVGTSRKEIAGGYVLAGNSQVSFRVARYDHKQPLIIDPVLSYSTYLGGNGTDEATAIAVDSAGNAYITGDTTSTNFPTTLGPATGDMFVAKLSPTGTKLYATYVGGTTLLDFPVGIGVDALGNAYVVGQTSETNLPTTPGALRTTYQGGAFDGFVFSLNSAGTGFNYFTYLGGSAFDLLSAVAVDSLGNAYITGQTDSGDYPILNPFETLAAAGDGGVFTTTNSGTNWTASATGLVNRNITVVAVDPHATTNIYAGTSESGVIASANSGTSWSAVNTGLTSLVVQALAVDPSTASKVYVGTARGGVFVTTNGGTSWATMNAGLVGINVHALAADPTGTGTLYASTGGNGVFKFAAGAWSATGALPQDIATAIVVDPTNNQNVYASFQNSGVYRSSNGGTSWAAFTTGLSSLQVAALAIDHGGHLYAGTRTGGVFLSTSGGSWTTINTGLPFSVFQALATDPTNNTTVYVGTFNGGVFRSTNNGTSWSQAANDGLNNTRVMALAVDPITPTNLYAGSQMVEAVVTKLSPTGGLVFSSYLGGGGGESGFGIAIDGDNGNLYVAGFTNSLNFPTVAPAQATMNGGISGFVSKVKSDGSGLTYSTYLGGSGNFDQAIAIAADSAGNAYVTGVTNSADFPTLNPTQAALAGTSDAFVAKYNASGQKVFATYLGGEGAEAGNAITVTANTDGSTSAWVAGQTTSIFFPVANPIQLERGNQNSASNAGFISDFNFPASGAAPTLAFSTYLGSGCGTGCDTIAQAIGHDGVNNIYVAGRTMTNNFPVVNAVQSTLAGPQNAFIAKIGTTSSNADLSLTLNSFGPTTVVAGSDVNFSLTVTNHGPNDAPNASLGGRGGDNSNLVTCTATQGVCGNNLQVLDRGFAELGTLKNGTSATVTGTLRPLIACGVAGAPVCPYVIKVDARSDANDPNPGNNSVTVNLTVLPGADLGVLLSEAPTPAQLNGPLTYTAVVFNLGPSPASAVTFTDPLPAGLSNVSASSTLGTCTPTTPTNSPVTVSCTIGAMSPGAFAVVTITGTLTTTPLANTVTVSNTPEADPDPTNNSATVTTSAQERLLFTDSITSSLLVLDPSNNTLLETTGAGTNAVGVAVSPNRRLAFVGNLNATYISVIDLTIGKEIRRIQGVRAARNLALTADGSLLVVPDLDKDDVAIIDTNSLQILSRVPLSNAVGASPGNIGVASVAVVGTLAFIDNYGATSTGNSGLPLAVVDLLSLQANQVNGTANGGFGVLASSLAATPDGKTVIAIRQSPDTLWIINPATNSVTQTVALAVTPFGIAVTPNGSDPTKIFGYLVHSGATGPVASVVDLRQSSLGTTFGHIVAGTDVTLPFGVNGGQVPMAVSRDGTRLAIGAIANTAGPNVAILDTGLMLTNPATAVVSSFHAGASPSSLRTLAYALADNGQPPATAPTVTTFSSDAINNADTAVTITGTNFAPGALVRIGKMDPIAASGVTPTSLSVVVPQNSPAQQGVDIIVTNPVPASGTVSIDTEHQSGVLAGQFVIFASPGFHPLNQVLNANFGDATVSLLNLRNKFNAALPASLGAMGVAVTPDGQYAYVTYFRSVPVQAITLSTGSVATIPLPTGANQVGEGDAVAIAPNPAAGTPVAYVLFEWRSTTAPITFDLQVAMIDANPASPTFNTVIRTLAAGLNSNTQIIPGGLAVTPDGRFVYGNDYSNSRIIVFDVVGNTATVLSTTTLGVSSYQPEVYVTPDGNSLLLGDLSANLAGAPAPVDVFDISTSHINPTLVTKIPGTAPPGGVAPSFGAYRVLGTQLFAYDTFQQLVQAFNFDRTHSNFAQLGSFVIPGHPSEFFGDLGVTPDGLLVYAQLYTDDAVAVLDAQALASGSANPLITKVATGLAPSSLAISSVTVAEPDLSVVINANPSAAVDAGGFITYTITVANARSTPATGVTLNTALSPSLTVNSVTTSQGSCNATGLPAVIGSFSCGLGTVNQGTPVTITVAAVAPGSGSIAITSSVTENEIDFNPTDNTASVTTPVVAAAADLAVFMTDSPHPPVVNSNYVYTITVSNFGPSPATGVVLTDVLPTGVNFVSVSGTGCSGSGTITCNIVSLGVGASTTVTITVTPTVSTPIVNTATVSGALPDPNPANNSYSVSSSSSNGLLVGDYNNSQLVIFPDASNLAQSGTSRTGANPVTVALSPNRRLAFVGNSLAGYISVEDLTLNREITRIRNVWVYSPMALTPDGTRLVALDGLSGNIVVINTATFQVQSVAGTTSTSYEAVAIAGNKAYFNPIIAGTDIGVLDLGTLAFSTIANTHQGGISSLGKSIVAAQGGQLVLAIQQSGGTVFVLQLINTNGNSVQTIPLGGFPLGVAAPQNAVASGGTFGYVATQGGTSTNLAVINLTPGSSTYGSFVPGATLNLPSFVASDTALSADGSKLYVIGGSTLNVVDTAQLRAGTAVPSSLNFATFLAGVVAGPIQTQPPASAPVVSSIGPGTSVTNDTTNPLTVNGSNFAAGATVRFGHMDPIALTSVTSTSAQVLLPQYAPAQANVEVIVTNPNSSSPVESQYQSGILGNGNSGFTINAAAAFTPANQVVISNFGDNTVSLLNPATKLTTPASAGFGPFGVAITPDGKVAYVEDAFSGQITSLNLATGATFKTFTFPGAVSLGTLEGVAAAPDPTNANSPIALVPTSVLSGSNFDAQLQIIDANSSSPTFNTVLRTLDAGLTANTAIVGAIAATPDGKFAYVSLSNGNILAFNIVTGIATNISGLGISATQFHMQVTADGKWLLAGSASLGISVFDLTTPTAPAAAGTVPPLLINDNTATVFFFGFQAVGTRLFAFGSTGLVTSNIIAAFNFGPSTVTVNQNFNLLGTFTIPGNVTNITFAIFGSGMAVTPDGNFIYATNQADDDVAVVSGNLLASGNANPLLTKVATGLGPIAAAVAPAAAPGPDMTISKSHTGNFIVDIPGVYTLTVTNVSNVATTGTITVTDTLPTGLGFVSGSGTGWSCSASAQVVTCTNPGPIAGNNGVSTITLTVSVAAAAVPSVTNTASVSTPGDNNPANKTASDPTTVLAEPDLSVSLDATPVSVGAPVTFTVTVTDLLSTPATGVTLSTTLSPSLTVNRITPGEGGTCANLPSLPANIASFTCSWTAVTLGGPATVTVTAVAPASGNACTASSLGCITVTSSVTENETDFNPANNSASVVLPVLPAVSPSGHFVYTNDDRPPSNTVSAFIAASDGTLTPIAGSPFTTGGTGQGGALFASNRIGVAITGNFLFASNAASNDVSVFTINPSTGALTLVPGSPFATGVSGDFNGIAVSPTPDGHFLMAANNGATKSITVFSIGANGALTPITGSPFTTLGTPDGIKVSPDGRFLAVAELSPDQVEMFSIASNGSLTSLGGFAATGGGNGVGSVDINCSTSFLYAGEFNASSKDIVDGYNIAANGTLTPVLGSPFLPGVGGNSNVVLLSTDDKTLFVSNQASSTITAFSVSSNGSLSLLAGSPFSMSGSVVDPSGMATSQDGTLLYVADPNFGAPLSPTISVFSVASNGALTEVAGSPFSTGQPIGMESLTAYPPKTCAVTPPVIAPTITKSFGAASIPLSGTTSLSFTINNPNSSNMLTGIGFTDTLPAGLVVSTPNGLSGSCGGGTITATAGSGSITLSGATIAASGSCTFSVNVTPTTTGVENNSVTVTSTNGGTGNTSNASITVLAAPPTIAKAFGAVSVPLNGSTSLTFNLANPNPTSLTGVGFSDTLPPGLVVATPNGLSGSCGSGAITATQGTSTISLSGATLAANGACSFSVTVTGASAGTKNNTTSPVTSTEGGAGGTASASIDVVAPPSISKAFGASAVPLNGTTTLSFTLTNPAANAVAVTGVAFTDTMPAGIVVANPNGVNNNCGGTLTATAGSGSISLSGVTIAVNRSCVITVNVTGTAAGNFTNTTGAVTSTNGGTGNTAQATLGVATPPIISKAFGAATIPLNGVTSLSFTITNPAANPIPLTGVAFGDTLPAGLRVSTPPGLSGSCGSGTITAAAGSSSISLSGGTLATNSSCNFSVNVTGVGSGNQVNTTGNVTSSQGGTGNAATASVTVLAPPDLTITKTHSDPFAQGQVGATYTITVNNVGGGQTSGTVTVSDNLPTGLTATAISGAGDSNWVCTLQPLGCTRSDVLAAGASYDPITLTVTVAANATLGQVTNTATVSGGGEVNTANDTANDVTNIVAAAANLVPAVAVIPPAAATGTTISYTVTVTNNGPSAATSVTMTDQLTGNAGFVSASSDTMTCPAPSATSLNCTLAVLNNGASVTVTITVNLTGAGWDLNAIGVTSPVPNPNPANHTVTVQRQSPGGNTVTGSGVAVQPMDSTSGTSPAVLTFADVTRGGTTTLASAANGPVPPAGFRTGTPAVFYNVATTAGYSGAIGVALGFNGASFHHPAKVRLFHSENGAWVDRTVAVSPAGGYAVALATSLSPFALFEPLNQIPVASAGSDRITTATGALGAKVTLDGSASVDPDGDPLTYRWTGPFPEGNGVVTGINPTVTMPLGGNRVTLVVNDSEADSAPVTQNITVTDFSVTAAAAGPTTISAGGSASFNISASSQFGPFPAAVTLACLGLPQGAQCHFSTTTVNAGGPAAVLTISTTPRTAAALAPIRHRNPAPLYTLWMPLPAIALMGLGLRRRSRKRAAALMLLLLLGMMLLLVSCGGGSMGVTPQLQNGTPAGTFTVTVLGTANGSLQHTTTVSFTVQ